MFLYQVENFEIKKIAMDKGNAIRLDYRLSSFIIAPLPFQHIYIPHNGNIRYRIFAASKYMNLSS